MKLAAAAAAAVTSAYLEAAHAEVRRLCNAAEAHKDSEAAALQALGLEHDAKQAALSRSQVCTKQCCGHGSRPQEHLCHRNVDVLGL